jgi:four helix bundle protein
MRAEKFEDLICWQKARNFAIVTYSYFKNNKDYAFRDQIQRASISISNNIAEGFERKSNKEFNQFLHIAKGSCGEVRSMLHIALELGYLNKSQFDTLYEDSTEISKIISGLSKHL